MLIENTHPAHRQVGRIYLMPGINDVDKKEWTKTLANGYKRSIDRLIKAGTLKMVDEKITISLVQSTYNVNLLEDWLVEAKGPLKGAIKKQMQLMTDGHKV